MLGAVGIAATVAVAGCGSRSPPLRVPEITVENWRESTHAVAVELRTGEDVVFESTVDLPPAEDDGDGRNQPSGQTWRPEATFDAAATLRSRIDGEEWQSVTLGDGENECVRPEVELRSGGRSVVGRRFECFGTGTDSEVVFR